MASLYLVPTPIGNLEDMTYRAVRVLRETEALACEDTRRTRVLLEHYGIPKPKTVFSYHEHNELAAGRHPGPAGCRRLGGGVFECGVSRRERSRIPDRLRGD